jgi:hypothetical protein
MTSNLIDLAITINWQQVIFYSNEKEKKLLNKYFA